jgi:hypothetical protein
MDDDDYLKGLLDKAAPADVAEYSWYECVEGFKKADRDMGSAFHRKLEWMNRASETYFAKNNKIAGFVGKFSGDTEISYDYASQLNRIRKTFSHCSAKNFSKDAAEILLSVPKELQEDFLSSEEPVTVKDVKQAKEGYKKAYGGGNEDLVEALALGTMKPREAAKKAMSRAEEAVIEFNALTEEQKVERLGGVKPVDAALQRKLDETLGDDFNPSNAATGILISLNRLRLFGGQKEIEHHMLGELHRSVRMQKYEAESLLMLADIISKNYDEIASYIETKPNLKVVN